MHYLFQIYLARRTGIEPARLGLILSEHLKAVIDVAGTKGGFVRSADLDTNYGEGPF